MGLVVSSNFLKREIAGLLGKPPRTIQYWTDIGLIIPDIQPSQGKGKARIYSSRNLLEFTMISVMVEHIGVKLETIKYIFQCLREGEDIFHREVMFSDYKDTEDIPGDKRILFKDFFENSDWGVKKELSYCESIDYFRKKCEIEKPLRFFHIIHVDEDGDLTFNTQHGLPGSHYPVETNVLWLGSIKNIALAKIGFFSD